MRFSNEQTEVINHARGPLLVSAAAGSGKTTTLVAHVLQRLETESIDRLVILTYTRAAAAEMRERIIQALTKRLESEPENRHLRQQLFGAAISPIGTIDSFCLSLVRDYGEGLDLSPDLRVVDDKELDLIKDELLEELLEEAYEVGRDAFWDLRNAYSSEKNHNDIKAMLLNLHGTAGNDPDPLGWLMACKKPLPKSKEAFQNSPWGQGLLRQASHKLGLARSEARLLCQSFQPVPEMAKLLEEDLRILEELLTLSSLEELLAGIEGAVFPRRPAKLPEDCKEVLEQFRGSLSSRKGYIYRVKALGNAFRNLDEELALLGLMEGPRNELIDLCAEFTRRLDDRCREKGIIDFAGLEHYALSLLMEKGEDASGWVPTELAKGLRMRYREVMVDEYQDVNQIQEYILQALAGDNLFMVGDVKQSIYRFRRAKPSIFVNKYESFGDGKEEGDQPRRIDLKENFRSRPEIIEGVNELFTALMSPETGGIRYDDKAALKAGAAYQGQGAWPLAVMIETDALAAEAARQEARYIAGEIHRLFRTGYQVYDTKEEAFRPLALKDVVVLLRTKSRAKLMAEELQKAGIAATYPHKSGFYDRKEVRDMLALLAVLDNPRQDIPLAAVMLAPFGGFSEEELALIQSRDASAGELWDHIQAAAGEDKVRALLDKLSRWRLMAAYLSLPELLRGLVEESGYGDYLRRRGNGLANIQELISMAQSFEERSGKGLYQFLRDIERQKKLQIEDRGEGESLSVEADVVQIDSIHASKGLEFPVVFLAQAESDFNMRDGEGDFLAEEEEGIALLSVDWERHIKTTNLIYQLVRDKIRRETLSEEIRLLYVAMTRARERLYLVGRMKDVEKERTKGLLFQRPKDGRLPAAWVGEQKNYAAMYLTAQVNGLLPHFPLTVIPAAEIPEGAALGALAPAAPEKTKQAKRMKTAAAGIPRQQETAPAPGKEPWPADIKSAYSVSELKKIGSGEEKPTSSGLWNPKPEAAEGFQAEEGHIKGEERGLAYHRLLEQMPWEYGADESKIRSYLEEAMARGRFSEAEKASIDTRKIRRFFEDSVGKRSLEAAANHKLWREKPFILGLPLSELKAESRREDLVLVQGIIDMFFEEDGQLILVDYKTDRHVTEEDLRRRHGSQLRYYARALEAGRQQKVSEIYLYSFFLDRFVPLEE